jgi:prephenate dehydrogenase
LTRVARLDPKMWTELFLENRENLSAEIGNLIRHLTEYQNAIDTGDAAELFRLLQDGRDKKDMLDDLMKG